MLKSSPVLLLSLASALHAQGFPVRIAARYDQRTKEIAGRAIMPVVGSLRVAAPTSMGYHVRLLAVQSLSGRPPLTLWSADSSRLEIRSSLPDSVAIEFVAHRDSALVARFGYLLYESTDSTDVWYPSPLGQAPLHFTVELIVDDGVPVLTSGQQIRQASSNGLTTYHLEARHVDGFALAVAPGYSLDHIERNGFRVHALALPGERAAFVRAATQAADAAAWYRQTYGFFPIDEFGIVPGYLGARGGFPLANMFMLHRGDLSATFTRWITAHELAHYYWGLYVRDAEQRLGWLTLALGIWTDQLYLATSGNHTLQEAWASPHYDRAFLEFATARTANYDQRLGLSAAAADSLAFDYNSLVRHAKAATGIYLVSTLVGPDAFVALQRNILSAFRDRSLTTSAFAAEVERAGGAGAGAFLAAWTRGDASIDYAVRSIALDTVARRGYWVVIERIGTVPFPVTVEIRGSRTLRHRFAGLLARDSVLVDVGERAPTVLIDPDGVLPMASSDHPRVRGLFTQALADAGQSRTFLQLVAPTLPANTDPHLTVRAIEHHFQRGDFAHVITLAQKYRRQLDCHDRETCQADILIGRAYTALGRRTEARAYLHRLQPKVRDQGSGVQRRLERALRETELAHR